MRGEERAGERGQRDSRQMWIVFNELMGVCDICTPGSLSESTLCYLPPHCHFSSFTHRRAVQQVRGLVGVCRVDRPKGKTGARKERFCTVEWVSKEAAKGFNSLDTSLYPSVKRCILIHCRTYLKTCTELSLLSLLRRGALCQCVLNKDISVLSLMTFWRPRKRTNKRQEWWQLTPCTSAGVWSSTKGGGKNRSDLFHCTFHRHLGLI